MTEEEKEIKKRKYKMTRNKITSGIVAVIMGITGFFGIKYHLKKQKVDSPENTIGYVEVDPFFNWFTSKVNDNEFVVLNVGDFDSNETWFMKSKIKYCNKHDISLGIVINSDSKKESDIYNDVEYAKSLIEKHKIDFPVYLDINNIITDTSLNIEMKTKLIKDFLEKCSSNGIYVGVYGTDENLCRMKEYCKITDYDAFLVKDKDEIKYDGVCSLVADQTGKIISKFKSTYTNDIAEVIEDKNLNNSEVFVNDGSYTVGKDGSLLDIVLKSGMSQDELLEYNGIKEKDITEGVVLRIPSFIETKTPPHPDEIISFMNFEKPARGCDLSYAQGTNIDWDKLKDNFEFIIIKSNEGMTVDSCFENNIKNCNLNNINTGVYCYNAYNKNNCFNIKEFKTKQIEQVGYTLGLLKNKKINYPIYLDIEGPVRENLPKEYVCVMLETWIEYIKESGYIPGIYCNQDAFKYLQSCVDYDLSSKFEMWIAGGAQYTAEKEDINLFDVKENLDLVSYTGAAMVQSTDSAVNCGAGNDKGHLDVNFCSKDYTKPVVEKEIDKQNWEIKQTTKMGKENITFFSGAMALVGGAFVGVISKFKKESKENNQNKKSR